MRTARRWSSRLGSRCVVWAGPLVIALMLTATAVHAAAPVETGRVIVKYKASALEAADALSAQSAASAVAGRPAGARLLARHTRATQALARRVQLPLQMVRGVDEHTQAVFARGVSAQALAAQLARDPSVEHVEIDQRRRHHSAPNDPLYPTALARFRGPDAGQWYLRPPDSTFVSAINAEQAWDVSNGSSSIVVAVLDTGVRFDHADLKTVALGGKLLDGYDMISDVSTAADGTARDADASDPGDYVSQGDVGVVPGCTSADVTTHSSWHGTQTAGLIGALTDNGVGMASVGRNVLVLPVRVLGKCGGNDSDIAAAIRWSAGLTVPGVSNNTHPARVISLSLGGEGACTQTYQDAITAAVNAGVSVIVSAGNGEGHAVDAPANCSGAIAVGGLRHAGTKVGYSNLGPEVVVSAPAGNCVNIGSNQPCLYPILTATNTGTSTPQVNGTGYTDSFNVTLGTSFSAPLVAGTAALMVSVDPTLTPAQVRSKLQATSRPFPSTGGSSGVVACHAPSGTSANDTGTSEYQDECYCTTSTCGAGMLDARQAVLSAAGFSVQINTSTAPAVGTALTLTAAPDSAGGSIASYQWTLIDGGGVIGGFNGATNQSTATVTPTTFGSFTVAVTVTYSNSPTTTTARTFSIAAPAPTSSGGGGAIDGRWAVGLLAASAMLMVERRWRERRS